MDDKVTEIPTKPNELRAALEEMKRAEDVYLEMAGMTARIRRTHYLAYIEEGFTKEEALVLCQKMTL